MEKGTRKKVNATRLLNIYLPLLSERNQHLFGIWLAERDISRIKHPSPRFVAAIEVKKLWLDGKISDEKMLKAWDGAGVDYYAACCAYTAYATTHSTTDSAFATEQTQLLCQILKLIGEQIKEK